MIVYGASGHARVIIDILLLNGFRIEKIIDADPRVYEIFGIPVEKVSEETKFATRTEAIVAIGSNSIRKKIAQGYSFNYIKAIHPRSSISPFAEVGAGTAVMANAVVSASVTIGRHCIINTGSVISHDCLLHDFIHISPNAVLAGNVTVGEGTHIGAGVSVIPGIRIGKWATVGAGAVIIRDVPDYATVVGNPGRVIKMGDSEAD